MNPSRPFPSWMLSLLVGAAICRASPADTRTPIMQKVDEVVAHRAYQPSWESLEHHRTPEWYEDAKFGIFIHWGIYSVPAFGNEWYPRNMYQQDSTEFQHHVETYGPQEKFGYREFIPRFTAAQYDPEHWAELFREAGAKFVVPVAEHHDGFAMYDSGLTEWCAAKMGPKRDLIGDLAKAVRKHGMVFGLSSHRAEHWWFFNGGRAVPSDVQDPRYAEFYGPAAPDKTQPDSEFLDDWLARTCELVDRYHPQLVWFDWWIEQPAFRPYLQRFAAYYYNRGAQWEKGVAINYKNQAFPARAAVLDIERGQLSGIRPLFWQTDTSVSKNSWGYVEHQDYKTSGEIIGDLIDIVSKNGALLLNIGPRPDGTIPEPEEEMLRDIGAWLKVNGEAIYSSRPWTTYGEGPTQVVGGAFNDTKRPPFTGQDLRFTRRGDTLYAIALAWPGERLTIKSLGTESPLAGGEVTGVRLLGHHGKLKWSRDAEGLTVEMPAEKPCDHAYALKISGLDLDRAALVRLDADLAETHGTQIRVETHAGRQNIGCWDNAEDWISWQAHFPRAGQYQVTADVAAAAGETAFALEVGDQRLLATAPKTESWNEYRPIAAGSIRILHAGDYQVRVKAGVPSAWKPLNLTTLSFRRTSN